MRHYSENEYEKISKSMIEKGDSFVTCIGKAIRHAEQSNKNKLSEAFPEYFEKYLTKL